MKIHPQGKLNIKTNPMEKAIEVKDNFETNSSTTDPKIEASSTKFYCWCSNAFIIHNSNFEQNSLYAGNFLSHLFNSNCSLQSFR